MNSVQVKQRPMNRAERVRASIYMGSLQMGSSQSHGKQ